MIFALMTLALQAASPSAGATCAVPNAGASVTAAVPPKYPDAARPASGTVKILVVIAPSGKAVSERIQQSSGNAAIDRAALQAAKRSTYRPKIVNCKPVQGSYLFMVTMQGR